LPFDDEKWMHADQFRAGQKNVGYIFTAKTIGRIYY
jgi:hypothetical protein